MKQELEDEARRIMNEADSLINLSQPRLTKEEVVLCTEQITKRIQELLLAAQAGKHSRCVEIGLVGWEGRWVGMLVDGLVDGWEGWWLVR
jgi:hypothetical protein